MHKLLQRQIKKVFGSTDNLTEQQNIFIDLVDESYNHSDEDRKRLERVLELTSEEMIKLNADIKKDATEALKLADARLKYATRAVNVGIWEFDLINKSVIWDDTTFKLYGLTSDMKIDAITAWRQHVHPEDQLTADIEMEYAITGKKEFDIEYRVILRMPNPLS